MKTIAVTNQKGGVGKTTTAINLATALALLGVKTLLIDLDPQANVTSGMGSEGARLEDSIYSVLIGNKSIKDIMRTTQVENLVLAPSGIDLVGCEIDLSSIDEREVKLKRALSSVNGEFRFVILDCPPSLGLITLNAMNAAETVLIPIQCEYYALEGLTLLMRTIEYVKERSNNSLEVEGIVFTMYDGRSNLSRQVREEVEKHFPGKTFRNWIPRNVRLAEAPGFGKPGVIYDSQSVGARAYKLLADELLQNNGIRTDPTELTPTEPVEVG